MTANQEKQLKDLYFTLRAYINESDVQDAGNLFEELESQVSKISKWIDRC